MVGREFLNQAGYSRELIPGEGMRYDENPPVGAAIIEKLNCKPDEIVSIPG
jgi:hypothetical protein